MKSTKPDGRGGTKLGAPVWLMLAGAAILVGYLFLWKSSTDTSGYGGTSGDGGGTAPVSGQASFVEVIRNWQGHQDRPRPSGRKRRPS